MNEIRFFVAGIPQSGGSKSAFAIRKQGIFTGKVAVTESGTPKSRQRKKDWRYAVTQKASDTIAGAIPGAWPLTGPVELELLFQMPRPKYHFRANGVELKPGSPSRHFCKPDVLKLARGTEDAMTGICYRDDCQISKELLEKAYSDRPGCWVTIRWQA